VVLHAKMVLTVYVEDIVVLYFIALETLISDHFCVFM